MATSMDIGGGGSASFPFDQVGASVTGTIRDLEEVQQTDLNSGDPSFWPDGKPKMMYRVTLQTDLRDPGDPSDDGERSIYLRGSKKPESQSSLAAVLTAVRATTGGTNLAVGGRLTLTYVGDGVAQNRGHNPPKFYSAKYEAPTVNLDAPAPQQPAGPQWPTQDPPPQWAQQHAPQPAPVAPVQAPQWPAQPVQQQAQPVAPVQQAAPPVAAPSKWTPEQLAAFAAAGIDPTTLG